MTGANGKTTNGRLLLHICCAPDATVAFERLSPDWHVVGYFFNPNIHPAEEYAKRLGSLVHFGCYTGMEIRAGEYSVKKWFNAVKGLESEPEKGRRCDVCFRFRLEDTARLAKLEGFDAFATVLTVSPHKNADKINQCGQLLSDKYHIPYLPTNLKKQDGFKRSVELSRKYHLYRQNYCGCKFSWHPNTRWNQLAKQQQTK
jgi:predicted adenine nucleotide alpha hydrolase (AANH) superfamily ATPase